MLVQSFTLLLLSLLCILLEIHAQNSSYGICYSCRRKSVCKNVTRERWLLKDGAANSPLYIPVVLYVEEEPPIDNICNTYYNIDDYRYLRFRSTVYTNGDYQIEKLIVGDVPGMPGLTRSQGIKAYSASSGRVVEDSLLATFCNYTVTVIYTCSLYESCETSYYNNIDFRYTVSPNKTVNDQCFSDIMSVLNTTTERYGFRGARFCRLPYQLPCRCVTAFNGAPCINAYKVATRDRFSLPDYSETNQRVY